MHCKPLLYTEKWEFLFSRCRLFGGNYFLVFSAYIMPLVMTMAIVEVFREFRGRTDIKGDVSASSSEEWEPPDDAGYLCPSLVDFGASKTFSRSKLLAFRLRSGSGVKILNLTGIMPMVKKSLLSFIPLLLPGFLLSLDNSWIFS